MVRITTGDAIPLVAYGQTLKVIDQTTQNNSGGAITAGSYYARTSDQFQAAPGVKVEQLKLYGYSSEAGGDTLTAQVYNITKSAVVGTLESGVALSQTPGVITFTGSVILNGDDGDIYTIRVASASYNWFWNIILASTTSYNQTTLNGASARLIKYDGTVIEVILEQVVGNVWMTNDTIGVAGTYGIQVFSTPIYEDYDYVEQYSIEVGGYADTVESMDVDMTGLLSDVTDILADTDELQTDWTNGGRLDQILDDTLSKVDDTFDLLGTGGAIELAIAAILADTDELQSDWTDGGRLDLLLDGVLADTIRLFDGALGTPTLLSFADKLMNKDNGQTFSQATDSLEAIRDRGDATWSGTGATKEEIADAVWDELMAGHTILDSAAKLIKDIATVLGTVQADTDDIQSRLPAALTLAGNMKSSIEEKNDLVGLSAQETLGVKAEVDQALLDYDGATQDDLDTAEASIISEIDAAELALSTQLGTPTVSVLEDLLARFDTVDSAIQANYDAIILIQNNVSTVLTGPKLLVRPDVGTKPYRFVVLNYDSVGNMENFAADPTLTGTYISGAVVYFTSMMVHSGLGQYYLDVNVGYADTLGSVQVVLDAEVAGTLAPRVVSVTSEVTDYDDELAEIKADTLAIYNKLDAGTVTPTIPQQLTDMEVNIVQEVDQNQTLLETIRDSFGLRLDTAKVLALNNGYTRLDNGEEPLAAGATELPIQDGTSVYFADSGFVALDDGVNREVLEYSSRTATTLVLVGATASEHEDGVGIYAVTRFSATLFLERANGQVYEQADSEPTLQILTEFGSESVEVMTWIPSENSYYYTKDYIATEFLPGTRNIVVSAELDGLTKYIYATVEVIDRPASSQQLEEAMNSAFPPGTFVFDHDGWKDEANILHEWDDVMAGPLRDDTGKPATGILVRAFLKSDEGRYMLVNNPPYHAYSNIFGHYRGSLEAGTYLFTFYKDNHKWKEVERTIEEED